MADIRDIARQAGASISTVSRVINGSGQVAAATRARVLAAIADMGYRPNLSARQMRGAGSRMVGVLLPALDVQFFSILAHEIEQELFAHGFAAMICSTAENPAHEATYLEVLISQRVEGILAVAVADGSDGFDKVRAAGIPVVALDRNLPGVTDLAVKADHAAGMAMAVRHVLSLGHTQIALVGAPAHSSPIAERLAGARAALALAGLQPLDVRLGKTHSFEACHDLVSAMLDDGFRPTAILGMSDIAAVAAIHALTARGFRVPQDVSVTGFDDLPAARHVLPQLTTVAQPLRMIGRLAVNQLLARIAGTPPPPFPQGALDLTLVLRGTTAPATD